jgi:hypothetical protein
MRTLSGSAAWAACLLSVSACGGLESEVSEHALAPFFRGPLPRPLAEPDIFAEHAPITPARPATDPHFTIAPPAAGAEGYVLRSGVTPYAFDQVLPVSDPFPSDPTFPMPEDVTLTSAIPFAFPYFGTRYPENTSVAIDSSGAMMLDPGAVDWPLLAQTVVLPSIGAAPALLAPFWGPLIYPDGAITRIEGHLDGVTVTDAPDKFVVAWVADLWSSGGGFGSWGGAELSLYPSGRIRMRYSGGGPANIGIQDASRQRGVSPSCAPNCTVADGAVYTFYPRELPHPELALSSDPLAAQSVSTTATLALDLGYRITNSGSATAAVVLTLLYRDDSGEPDLSSSLFLTTGVDGRLLAQSLSGPTLSVAPGQTVAGRANFDLTNRCLYCTLALYAAPANPEDDDGDRLLTLGSTWLLRQAQIVTTALPDGVAGEPYRFQLSGNLPLLGWWSQDLPSFLSLSTDGVLTGIPVARGAYTFTVSAGTASTTDDSKTFTLTVR